LSIACCIFRVAVLGIAASPPRCSIIATDSLAVVSPVAEHLIGIAVDLLHQGREGGDVVRLPGRDDDPDRQARGVGAGVDFGREAAARTTERVALGPPFPPAAQ
jgi:hypothetical protein